jgi:predicted methyltransferase
MQRKLRLVGLGLLVFVAACADRSDAPAADSAAAPPAPAAAPPEPAASAVDYQAAVAAASRPAADRDEDARRKPAETLAFFGVERGMTALDLFSGGGYYTELLAAVVGPTGRVVAHNNSAYLNGLRDELAQRFGAQRLPNVERLEAEGNALELPLEQFDFVLLSNVYHDVYYVDVANGWPAIDGARLVAEVFASMKPGATLWLIDHAAAPGSPAETGGTLHRIDPELVKRDFAAAGFVLDAESDLLRNPADDRTKGVFDPAVRGQTDRFMLRFRKP